MVRIAWELTLRPLSGVFKECTTGGRRRGLRGQVGRAHRQGFVAAPNVLDEAPTPSWLHKYLTQLLPLNLYNTSMKGDRL